MKPLRSSLILGMLIALMTAPQTSHAQTGGFCAGYQGGFSAGACYQKFGCIQPIPPICPIPGIGEDSYQDGYNRGFLAGLARRN